MKKRNRFFALALTLVMVTGLLSGCGDGGSGGNSTAPEADAMPLR